MSNSKFRFSIDRGGTFTDIYAEVPITKHNNNRPNFVMKLLSVDPQNYDDAPREGIRRIISKVLNINIPTAKDIDTSVIEYIRMGTTVATNALLERNGADCALITTNGFRDLLQIGNQSRPKIFDLVIQKPSLLYKQVIEVDERVRLCPAGSKVEGAVAGASGDLVKVLKEPNYEDLAVQLKKLLNEGIQSVAVVLIHAFTFTEHEVKIGQLCKELGFKNVSLSHQIMPMIRAVPRGFTTCVDAYLTPIIRQYVDNFCAGFKNNLQGVNVTFMQSDGGLTPANEFMGCRAVLSGPAGGVVGYATTAYDQQEEYTDSKDKLPVIGFDMGGTSTDVSRYAGMYDHVYETELAGIQIQAPQLDIQTVAAGGGSRLIFNDATGAFQVGPESVGAHPGPVCYRKGGKLAITDANLFLGRLLPEYFPNIFGPNENEPLDVEAVNVAFEELTAHINKYLSDHGSNTLMTPEQVAEGFIQVANETMSRPIRSSTVSKGYDTRDHILSCFGGAGAQHACQIANQLGMSRVVIHRQGGILSAYGLGLAHVVKEVQEPCNKTFSHENISFFHDRLTQLESLATSQLTNHQDQRFDRIESFRYLNMRYHGTDFSIMIHCEAHQDYKNEFEKRYKREYGFTIANRNILVDDIRVRCVGRNDSRATKEILPSTSDRPIQPIAHSNTFFSETGRTLIPVYDLQQLPANYILRGPCIVIYSTTTIVVNPNSAAKITSDGNVTLTFDRSNQKAIGTDLDGIQLTIFSHRFMSIAEQMGRTLQRTSISTNIKERLDFSCAIFGPDGALVANAPHLPVHLGSMSEAVKFQISHLKSDWKSGQVIMSNHPCAGGTHLPDITVITPVFVNDKPVFYVASRGHHADIGGISPGSMPPFSRRLDEEGMAVMSFKLVRSGEFQQDGIEQLLNRSGARNIKDNVADLKAQVAANQKGIYLLQDLIKEYGLDVVHAYMIHVQNHAELAVRQMLKTVFEKRADGDGNFVVLRQEDYMDDGSVIQLKVNVYGDHAEFDFAGTGAMVLGNTNAPKSITVSAILYCLRCMVKQDIPLNEGCLKPIRIKIPKYSLLDIGEESNVGVVGGNVLTSMRVTDVILKAFDACAASQGCMNNFTFGNEKMGYYETIAGGAGAGPTWQGCDSVQTHMTNTRITDVEILEKRYPVLLRQFAVRHGSGGEGKFRGGHGVVREFEFLENLDVGILSERRVFSPFGMNGGGDGAKGENQLISGGLVHNLGGKNAFKVTAGDRVVIKSPGGGAWGSSV
ncbi:5-oxoprolinase [Acrasis kona]|uniref:5-oxoprolinase n=1 Tax=Acrasis kona TaxID=1008807 RepID=A0AAW2ZIC0_9EUKA